MDTFTKAKDGRALGAEADALETRAMAALNRAKQMLLRGRWDETQEAIRAAEGCVAGLRAIEARAGVPSAIGSGGAS